MNPYNIPPLPPINQLPAPGQTSTNPGIVNPADQAYPAVKSAADQTQLSNSLASASAINSNGEQQRSHPNVHSMASSGVTVNQTSAPLQDFSGDSGQLLDLRLPTPSQSTGSGLAAEVFPGSVSHAKFGPPPTAIALPPAINVPADTRRSGGLPKNVNIR